MTAARDTVFVTVDGEGVTHADGTHDYVVLSVGDKSYHRNGARLGFSEVMQFLYRQHQLNPTAAFVGFYLSYDFSQWLRELPASKAWLLFHDDGIASRARTNSTGNRDPFPVRWSGWEFDIMPGMRRFKLRPCVYGSEPWAQKNVWSWMTICDAGPFWQTSFLNAVNPDKWTGVKACTPEQYEIIKAGKEHRSDARFDLAMIKYNITENLVLANAMTALDVGFRDSHIKLRKDQWFGPGQAVQNWMRLIGAPTRADVEAVTPAPVVKAAQATYYGGWFEIPRHGHVKGVSYEYDINSAYPHIIASLPCLLHGRWIHNTPHKLSHAQHTLAHVTTHGTDTFLGGLPHRDGDGIICRPHSTRGWYWQHEIDAAQRAKLIDTVTYHETWTYEPCNCLPPMAAIKDLYNRRLQVGKNTATGKALKLVVNSAYGKTAQSTGTPTFANPIYASLITAGCRTMMLDAIATHPDRSNAVLMVATDGIYFRTRHPSLRLSNTELGAWDETERENLTLFMPGIYWDDESRRSLATPSSIQIKSRGINGYDLAQHITEIDHAYDAGIKDWPSFTIPVRFSVITPKLALARGKWGTCGTVITTGSKTLSSDPSNKRNPSYYISEGLVTTRPYDSKGATHPYRKTFGFDIETIIDNDEWMTDDGTLNMELVNLLGMDD